MSGSLDAAVTGSAPGVTAPESGDGALARMDHGRPTPSEAVMDAARASGRRRIRG